MSDNTFRSKYASMPGSLVAIRVDYARRSNAFDPLPGDSRPAEVKRDVKRWKMGHRLGDTPEWNPSAQPEGYVGGAPQRANLRQLSEYQGIKLEYNFRASKLPDVNKQTRFVPKPSKLQVDRSIFLPPKEQALLVRTNAGTTTALSRNEMNNEGVEGAEREAGWNQSAALERERTDIYKLRSNEDFREINKTKSVLDHSKYVPPQKRQVAAMKHVREEKLAKREAEAKARALRDVARGGRGHAHSAPGGHSGASGAAQGMQPVFKMSNIAQWWDDDFDSKMIATASAVLGRTVTVDGVETAPAAKASSGGQNDAAPADDDAGREDP